MLGEALKQVSFTSSGICGDRTYAVWDHATGRVASAKNPRLWSALLGYRARFLEQPLPDFPSPIAIEPAQGGHASALLSTDPNRNKCLSAWLGRPVSLLDKAPNKASLDQYWPDVKDREYRNVIREMVLPKGTFLDSCQVHAISTSTLERLRSLEPQLDYAVERFRPNLLIRTPNDGEHFPEEQWIGHLLRLGKTLTLKVNDGCPRCVVTTLAQGGLPEEIEILRGTARNNNVVAGIRLSVVVPGPLMVGDVVTMLT